LTEFIASHPLPALFLAIAGTLISKYAWDRWMSQGSRVTRIMCDTMRLSCRAELLKSLAVQSAQLDDGDDCFKTFSQTLMVLLLAQLKVCEHLKIDCADIRKAMVDKGILN